MKEVDNDILQFGYLSNHIVSLYDDFALRAGMSDSEYIIIYTICAIGDGCQQKDICELTAISKKTVNSAIHRMERQGIICMRQGRGRSMHIYLTDEGRRFTKEKVVPVLEIEKRIFSCMDQEERRELLRLMGGYLASFRAVEAEMTEEGR